MILVQLSMTKSSDLCFAHIRSAALTVIYDLNAARGSTDINLGPLQGVTPPSLIYDWNERS